MPPALIQLPQKAGERDFGGSWHQLFVLERATCVPKRERKKIDPWGELGAMCAPTHNPKTQITAMLVFWGAFYKKSAGDIKAEPMSATQLNMGAGKTQRKGYARKKQ